MPTTKIRPLPASKLAKALGIVAEWLGPRMGYDGPAPTGFHAAFRAEGPELDPTWGWPGKPTPTILLEGGPDDWAVEVSFDEEVLAQFKKLGIYTEPYAGYALCLYRA